MPYCTNAADDGRAIEIFGIQGMRRILGSPDVDTAKKDELLFMERSAVADYYNWLFDRGQERKDTK
jgi:hypothetical protein